DKDFLFQNAWGTAPWQLSCASCSQGRCDTTRYAFTINNAQGEGREHVLMWAFIPRADCAHPLHDKCCRECSDFFLCGSSHRW
ncbi:hypothetical protein CIB84_000756, partial [Bambusicola thoracicus]